MWIYTIVVFSLLGTGSLCSPCNVRSFGDQKTVCVCNETYCDELVLLSHLSPNEAAVYETNKKGDRFKSSILQFTSVKTGLPILSVNHSQYYQFVLGFGGAFTDAAGINFQSLSPLLQKKLLTSYFTEAGLQYNMGRVPIASCDFSTHAYSYDDVKGDFNLTHFNLTKEDFLFKIPFIKMAQAISTEQLLLFGSPWSAPAWMKTNNDMKGQGSLKGEPGQKYYKTWANYLIRFLEEYRKNNIEFWGLTLQNEPTDGCLEDFRFQAMCFPAEHQRDFLKMDLGPAMLAAGLTPENMRLMIVDDDRVVLPHWADVILQDPEAARYVSGIAFHWYLEDLFPHKLLEVTHARHSDKFFLATEACTGSYNWEFPKVDLGSWERAERYAHDIIQDLLNWSVGWIDWNLVLDMQGGPNWVKNYVDAPIIANIKANEFYKQPMYYALAQFSKCLPRGSFRIGLSDLPCYLASKLEIAAFQTPKDKTVVIVVNRQEEDLIFNLYDPLKGYLNVTSHSHSIQTYVW